MLAILAYAIGVMYTPGPVNLLGLNAGLNGQFKASIGFFVGVGLAMLIMLLAFGWLGAALVRGPVLICVSALGCLYIGYLAIKIARADVPTDTVRPVDRTLRFRQGLVMQLLNPKGLVATLPIATIQFPAAEIYGTRLVVWSVALALLAVGAPGSYALAGDLVGRRVGNLTFFRLFNRRMAGLLLYVAATIAYEHVVLPLA